MSLNVTSISDYG